MKKLMVLLFTVALLAASVLVSGASANAGGPGGYHSGGSGGHCSHDSCIP